MLHIFLDTSVLITAADDPTPLVEAARNKNLRILVSPHSIDEMFAGRDEHRSMKNGRGLLKLWRELPNRIEVTLHAWGIWAEEAKGALTSTPTDGINWESHLAAAVRGGFTADLLGEVRQTVNVQKDQTMAIHKHARGVLQQHVKDQTNLDELIKEVEVLDPAHLPDWILEGLLKDLERPAEDARLVKEETGRYLSLRAEAAMLYLDMFGNSIPPKMRGLMPGDLAAALKPGRGDDYDNVIACSAAYCDAFIVDDRALREQCNFLRRRRLLRFESLTWADFIEKVRR